MRAANVTGTITVTVEGTSKSATTDAVDRFTLTGLPEGRLQLRFTGSGVDARLPITVGKGEQINISVRVDRNSATIESEHRAASGEGEGDGDHDEGEIEGRATGLSGTCPNLSFTVNGIRVRTNSSTKFEDHPCSYMEEGRRVEVDGAPVNGVVTATRVEQY